MRETISLLSLHCINLYQNAWKFYMTIYIQTFSNVVYLNIMRIMNIIHILNIVNKNQNKTR